jgi:hypothetical protein
MTCSWRFLILAPEGGPLILRRIGKANRFVATEASLLLPSPGIELTRFAEADLPTIAIETADFEAQLGAVEGDLLWRLELECEVPLGARELPGETQLPGTVKCVESNCVQPGSMRIMIRSPKNTACQRQPSYA